MPPGLHVRREGGGRARGPALAATLLLHAGLAAVVLLSRTEGFRPSGAAAEPPMVALFTVAPDTVRAEAPEEKLAEIPLQTTGQPVFAVVPEIQSIGPALPKAHQSAPPVAISPPQSIVAPPTAAPAPVALPSSVEMYQETLWQWVAARRPQGIYLEGEATIAFTLDRQGRLISASIAQSSGNKLLDRLALRTIRTAAPYPTPPADMPDEALHFRLVFSFH